MLDLVEHRCILSCRDKIEEKHVLEEGAEFAFCFIDYPVTSM